MGADLWTVHGKNVDGRLEGGWPKQDENDLRDTSGKAIDNGMRTGGARALATRVQGNCTGMPSGLCSATSSTLEMTGSAARLRGLCCSAWTICVAASHS
jgi:hypothetical protein